VNVRTRELGVRAMIKAAMRAVRGASASVKRDAIFDLLAEHLPIEDVIYVERKRKEKKKKEKHTYVYK
jgi:predicted protein tyrosine phosphatase